MTTATNHGANANFWTDDQRWQAVLGRDRSADNLFVYSVKTTGIYCRPSCPARRAKRENIRFHATPALAEQAGFRPCRRCKPNDSAHRTSDPRAVVRACELIHQAGRPIPLNDLAAAVGLSPSHFHRLFRTVTGVTPKAYAAARRAERMRHTLAHSRTVTEAIYDAGFNSNGRFYASSTESLGMTPQAFRRGGQRTTIRFAVAQCSLGAILVAATEIGICAIAIGDDPSTLVEDLQDRFPHADLIGGDDDFEKTVAQAVGFVERPAQVWNLPLDIQGTVFQQQVWRLLQQIPCGETATYTEIANRLGQPQAVRAVASACAANKIAVAIPCHRVVRTDGSLSGYRWGIERKAELLQRERSG